MDMPREDTFSGYVRASRELGSYLAGATATQLRYRSTGTKWTNEELLFHMVFGHMIVRTLLPLVRISSHLPRSWSKAFARVLNASTTPFDIANYWGTRPAALPFNRNRMQRQLERTTRALTHHLTRETTSSLERAMDFPTRWDPYFKEHMSLSDVYAYPTLHFDFHARQLNLDNS